MASQVLALQKCFKSIAVKVHGSCDFNQLQHGDTCHPSTVVLDEERRHPVLTDPERILQPGVLLEGPHKAQQFHLQTWVCKNVNSSPVVIALV